MLDKAKQMKEQAAQKAAELREQASNTAGALKESVASSAEGMKESVSVRAGEMKESALQVAADAKEASVNKAKEIIDQFNASLPIVRKAGYTVTEVEIALGIPPKISASVTASGMTASPTRAGITRRRRSNAFAISVRTKSSLPSNRR